jgi:hypothetical protein
VAVAVAQVVVVLLKVKVVEEEPVVCLQEPHLFLLALITQLLWVLVLLVQRQIHKLVDQMAAILQAWG